MKASINLLKRQVKNAPEKVPIIALKASMSVVFHMFQNSYVTEPAAIAAEMATMTIPVAKKNDFIINATHPLHVILYFVLHKAPPTSLRRVYLALKARIKSPLKNQSELRVCLGFSVEITVFPNP